MSTNQTIKSHATTREYVANYQQTDMAKPELGRYCEACGRLPAWCVCEDDNGVGSGCLHGLVDSDGVYHPAPGYNVIVENL